MFPLTIYYSEGLWKFHEIFMMTSSNGNSFRVTGHLCEFPAQRPVTQSFKVFFDLCLNEQLSRQLWGWWFEMPLCSLWHHRDVAACLFWYQATAWAIADLFLLTCRDKFQWSVNQNEMVFIQEMHFKIVSKCQFLCSGLPVLYSSPNFILINMD